MLSDDTLSQGIECRSLKRSGSVVCCVCLCCVVNTGENYWSFELKVILEVVLFSNNCVESTLM